MLYMIETSYPDLDRWLHRRCSPKSFTMFLCLELSIFSIVAILGQFSKDVLIIFKIHSPAVPPLLFLCVNITSRP